MSVEILTNRSRDQGLDVPHFGVGYDLLTTANKPELAIPDFLVFVGNNLLPKSCVALRLLFGLEGEPGRHIGTSKFCENDRHSIPLSQRACAVNKHVGHLRRRCTNRPTTLIPASTTASAPTYTSNALALNPRAVSPSNITTSFISASLTAATTNPTTSTVLADDKNAPDAPTTSNAFADTIHTSATADSDRWQEQTLCQWNNRLLTNESGPYELKALLYGDYWAGWIGESGFYDVRGMPEICKTNSKLFRCKHINGTGNINFAILEIRNISNVDYVNIMSEFGPLTYPITFHRVSPAGNPTNKIHFHVDSNTKLDICPIANAVRLKWTVTGNVSDAGEFRCQDNGALRCIGVSDSAVPFRKCHTELLANPSDAQLLNIVNGLRTTSNPLQSQGQSKHFKAFYTSLGENGLHTSRRLTCR
ncbi:hypothetical protein SprV_0301025800 [Sparganum proliferum]